MWKIIVDLIVVCHVWMFTFFLFYGCLSLLDAELHFAILLYLLQQVEDNHISVMSHEPEQMMYHKGFYWLSNLQKKKKNVSET